MSRLIPPPWIIFVENYRLSYTVLYVTLFLVFIKSVYHKDSFIMIIEEEKLGGQVN